MPKSIIQILFNNESYGEREKEIEKIEERKRKIKQKIPMVYGYSSVLFVFLHAGLLDDGGPEVIQKFPLFIHFSKQS